LTLLIIHVRRRYQYSRTVSMDCASSLKCWFAWSS